MKCTIDLGLVRKLAYLRERERERVSLCERVCVHAYLFFHSLHMLQLRIGTVITQ